MNDSTSDTIKVDTARLPLLLRELRLPTIAAMWQGFTERADREGWPAARLLATLTELELAERDQRRIQRHLLEARLPPGKTFDGFDFAAVPMLSRAHVAALATGSSTIWSMVRVPPNRRTNPLAGPSVSVTRSGASNIHALRVVSKRSWMPGARRGRSGGRSSGIRTVGHEGASRDHPRGAPDSDGRGSRLDYAFSRKRRGGTIVAPRKSATDRRTEARAVSQMPGQAYAVESARSYILPAK
jgi:IstB-like ATP binding protein